MEFADRVVFVSGANRGIGKALVEALLRRGVAKVYAAARRPQSMADFGDSRVTTIELDITQTQQVALAAHNASDTQILINNAGVAHYTSAFDGPMDQIANDMDVNYFGTLAMMRAFIPILEGKADAMIANVVSIVAFANFPFLGGYSASKAALFSITQGARLALINKGINVHSINPGPIDTDMAAGIDMDKTSPQVTAQNILDGLEAGEPDIFPDPIGLEMFQTWSHDYRDLENRVAQMLQSS